MQKEAYQKEIVNFFLKKGVLISADVLQKIKSNASAQEIYSTLSEKIDNKELSVLFEDLVENVKNIDAVNISWREFEKSKVVDEKNSTCVAKEFASYVESSPKEQTKIHSSIRVERMYEGESKKRVVQDFVKYFSLRYKGIRSILEQRRELMHIISINRLLSKKDREQVSVIGMVTEKSITKNGNIMLTIEDLTGKIKTIINKNKPQLFQECKSIVLDEVLGITGVNGDGIIFANNVLWPDIPLTKELKKSPNDEYAIFLSDLHVGSNKFLHDDFMKFIQWLQGKVGNDSQKEIASKIKYIFIAGDLVDGVGIYPGQEDELTIKDVVKQYDECAHLLRQIPSDKSIIICPGNHDAMRVAEPQPLLYKDFAKALYTLPNATLVSNPSIVNFGSTNQFSGFDVLLYHGYSFDFFVSEVDEIRNNGGYDRADLIMKFLLKRRHLAPSHKATLYVPDTLTDPLVIDKIPDFFVTGHIHKSSVSSYRNITIICGSCWQDTTDFQIKVGHHPEPGRVPIINLRTRQIKLMKFLRED